jgi:hypothetical protein
MSRMPDDDVRTRAEYWRRLTAWLFPALAVAACLAFFVSMATSARWVSRPFAGSSLGSGTVAAAAILLAILFAILAYAWLAEHADRDASARTAPDR